MACLNQNRGISSTAPAELSSELSIRQQHLHYIVTLHLVCDWLCPQMLFRVNRYKLLGN